MIINYEVYEEGIDPEVIKKYERYIERGLIKKKSFLDIPGIDNDPSPCWTKRPLSEKELLKRIEEADRWKEKATRIHQEKNNKSIKF